MAAAKGKCPCNGSLVELKSLPSPPQQVKEVAAAVVILLGDFPVSEATTENTTSAKLSDKTFMTFKRTLASPKCNERMWNFDPKTVTPEQMKAAKFAADHITLDEIKKKSAAAGDLLKWVKKVISEGDTSA